MQYAMTVLNAQRITKMSWENESLEHMQTAKTQISPGHASIPINAFAVRFQNYSAL